MAFTALRKILAKRKTRKLLRDFYTPDEIKRLEQSVWSVAEALGHRSVTDFLKVVSYVAEDDREKALGIVHKGSEQLETLVGHVGKPLVQSAFDLSERVGRHDADLGAVVFDNAYETFPELSEDVSRTERIYNAALGLSNKFWQTATSFVQHGPEIVDKIGFSRFYDYRGIIRDVIREEHDDLGTSFVNESARLLDLIDFDQLASFGSELQEITKRNQVMSAAVIRNAYSTLEHSDFDAFKKYCSKLRWHFSRKNNQYVTLLIDKIPFLISGGKNIGYYSEKFDQIEGRSTNLAVHLLTNIEDIFEAYGGIRSANGSDNEFDHFLHTLGLYAVYCDGSIRELAKAYPSISKNIGTVGFADICRLTYHLGSNQGSSMRGFDREEFVKAVPGVISGLTELDGKDFALEVISYVSKSAGSIVVHDTSVEAALFLESPKLIGSIGYSGFVNLARLIDPFNLTTESSSAFKTLIEKSGETIDALLEHGDLDFVQEIFERGLSELRSEPLIGINYILKSPKIIEELGVSSLEIVADISSKLKPIGHFTDKYFDMLPDVVNHIGYDGARKVTALINQTKTHQTSLVSNVIQSSPGLVSLVGYEGFEKIIDLARMAHSYDETKAKVLMNEATGVVSKLNAIGPSGFELAYGQVLDIARSNAAVAASYFINSPGFMEYGEQTVERIAIYSGRLSRHSGEVASLLLDNAKDMIDKIGIDAFEQYGNHAVELAERNMKEAEAFLRGESRQSVEVLEQLHQGLALKDAKPVLIPYVHGLLGYPVEIREGPGAMTDGDVMYLPERVNEFREDERNFRRYKVLSTHETGHLAYGSFDFQLTRVPDLVSKIQQRKNGRRK